jgi:dihydroxyacetone kinase-like protein
VARKAVEATRTIGVALTPCRVPTSDVPNFQIGNDEIEMGMGIHGEPGIWRAKLGKADAVVEEMWERLLADRPMGAGSRVSVLVNGLGATPLEELFILYRRTHQILSGQGITVVQPLVGNYVTSMEMGGASLSVHLLDPELEELLLASARCPFWKI